MVDVFPVTQVLSTIPTEREQSLKETEMKMKYN